MREEEGREQQPPVVATGPAVSSLPAAPAAERGGLRVVPPLGLAEHKSCRPAAAAMQGDRGEGRLQSRVTSRQNNSRAVGEHEANAANYVYFSLCENRQERSGLRSCKDA